MYIKGEIIKKYWLRKIKIGYTTKLEERMDNLDFIKIKLINFYALKKIL